MFDDGEVSIKEFHSFDDEEKIINDVEEIIEVGKQKGGFILSTACSIASMVKKENIQLLSKLRESLKT
ncbi:MAG: hypothetical protein KJ666_08890 [Bacteroidetes bacterium]|nr:hypothetical protein [Bacteroidota bacterium]